MGLKSNRKEMLYILGQFFSKAHSRFAETPLKFSISKAEFIDVIRSLMLVDKKERAIYKNLEELEKHKYLVYDDRNLRLSRKGFDEYERIRKEYDRLAVILQRLESGKIRFKRKIQTKFTS